MKIENNHVLAPPLQDSFTPLFRPDPISPEEIIDVMKRLYDLDISSFDPQFLMKSVERRVQATDCISVENYLTGCLVNDYEEAITLYRSLRIGYSTFFRSPLTYALLEVHVLPDLIDKAKKSGRSGLRIWSAGCSAGQECWSLAMLLDQTDIPPARRVSWLIFGTDLHEPDLATARTGIYSSSELGNVRLQHLHACFTPQNEGFSVATHLRDHVEFSLFDLLDSNSTCPPSSIFGDFDLILCCNVLIYYRPAHQRQILDKLLDCLTPGGYLVTGETERWIAYSTANLHKLTSMAPIFYKNKGDL